MMKISSLNLSCAVVNYVVDGEPEDVQVAPRGKCFNKAQHYPCKVNTASAKFSTKNNTRRNNSLISQVFIEASISRHSKNNLHVKAATLVLKNDIN